MLSLCFNFGPLILFIFLPLFLLIIYVINYIYCVIFGSYSAERFIWVYRNIFITLVSAWLAYLFADMFDSYRSCKEKEGLAASISIIVILSCLGMCFFGPSRDTRTKPILFNFFWYLLWSLVFLVPLAFMLIIFADIDLL